MRVTVLMNFYDVAKGVDRMVGEEYVVTKERFEQVNAIGMEKVGSPILAESERTDPVGKQTPESRAKRTRKVAK
ncbi:MAG: hypothetical protein IKG69_07845 [Atopobiaceae bacterium]|nr:hypothetical protein [Atopobiaceae bacterium]